MNFYSQTSGRWTNAGTLLFTGYSGGNEGANPEGVNNPALQQARSIGPIPCGIYRIGAPETWANAGKYVLPLTPEPGTNTFGRTAFGCHGDLIGQEGKCKASKGCIIAPGLAPREAVWAVANAGDNLLTVVATDDEVPEVC